MFNRQVIQVLGALDLFFNNEAMPAFQ